MADPKEPTKQPYELKPETLDKLGLNVDGTEKAIEAPVEIPDGVDEHGNEIRTYSDAEIGINIGNDFLFPKKKDTEKKADETPEPVEATPPAEAHPSKQAAEEKKPDEQPQGEATFNDQVIERLKKFEDAELQTQFLKDLDNYEKFMANNTQKAQSIADERKKLEMLVTELGVKDYQGMVDEILKLDDLKDFLESADDWYSEHEGGNPFRKLIEHWRTSNDKVLKHHESKSVFEEERSALELEKEVFELQKLDDRYRVTETLIELADNVADKYGVDLKTAHKIWLADNLTSNVTELNDKIKAMDKDKAALKKELKDRNAEITELKKKAVTSQPGVIESVGAESFDYSTPSSGFDETEQRLYKKLGVA